MADHAATGTDVVVISPHRLAWAVNELAGLDAEQLSHVKVPSGEHLAGLLLTAFLKAPPAALDTHGGVDFLFRLSPDERLAGMPPQESAAFEVKSTPGPFRKVDAFIDRMLERGDDPAGTGVDVVIEGAADILESAWPIAEKIGGLLSVKAPTESSRNGFLIIHPLDRLALEAIEEAVMAPHLPPVPSSVDLDTLWVLWFPDHLTMWSRERRRWTEMIFASRDPRSGDEPDMSVLQQAGTEFLVRIGYSGRDPYLFGLHAAQDRGGGQ